MAPVIVTAPQAGQNANGSSNNPVCLLVMIICVETVILVRVLHETDDKPDLEQSIASGSALSCHLTVVIAARATTRAYKS